MRMLACLCLVAAALLGCGPATSQTPPPANPAAAGSRACSFDADCYGGRCENGMCSAMPAAPTKSGEARCTIDTECPGGRCEFGTCTLFPRPTQPSK